MRVRVRVRAVRACCYTILINVGRPQKQYNIDKCRKNDFILLQMIGFGMIFFESVHIENGVQIQYSC